LRAEIVAGKVQYRRQIEPVHYETWCEIAVAIVAIGVIQGQRIGAVQPHACAVAQVIVPAQIKAVAIVKHECVRRNGTGKEGNAGEQGKFGNPGLPLAVKMYII
jgi:hypothetical protein